MGIRIVNARDSEPQKLPRLTFGLSSDGQYVPFTLAVWDRVKGHLFVRI